MKKLQRKLIEMKFRKQTFRQWRVFQKTYWIFRWTLRLNSNEANCYAKNYYGSLIIYLLLLLFTIIILITN